ncbi:hypothetical protein [Flavobacterium sp.]|jgi:hypothetical protein|uniref:hypothetical protein n=1 Tax=Flavobacterium sp. TaxID=239 RepID=UPI0037845051
MKKKLLFTALIALLNCTSFAQLGGLKKLIPKKETPNKTEVKTESKSQTDHKTQTQNSSGEYQTLGITSEAHKKNMGKIVFAPQRSDIAFQSENEANFRNAFTFGDEIYFRVYMDNSLSNYFIKSHPEMEKSKIDENSYYTVYYFLDGVQEKKAKILKNEFEKEHKQEWTSFKGALNNGPNRGDDLLWGSFDGFLRELDTKLSNGKHKIKVEIRPCIDNPNPIELATVASGEIDFTVTPTSINKNDESFCLKKANMKDAALEAKVLKLFAADKSNAGTTPKSCRITSKEWVITRNDLTGRILRRNLVLLVVALDKDGKYFYKDCYIAQEYVGGQFSNTINFSCDDYQYRVNRRCIE